jgi:hypothetical protein
MQVHWFVGTIFSLAVGALLLLLGTVVWYTTGDRYTDRTSVTIDGSAFELFAGEGEVSEETFLLTGRSERGHAIAVTPELPLGVERFERLVVRASGTEGRRLGLLSDDPDRPGSTRFYPLQFEEGVAEIAPGRIKISGRAARIGILVQGDLSRPVILHGLRLIASPPGAVHLLTEIWSEWTAFEGWRGHSINFIAGGVRKALLPPVLAAALWVALSAAIYGLFAIAIHRPRALVPFAVIFMTGWLMLDLRWQVDLARQLEITHETFAGKSSEEKGLVAVDGDLFRVARALHGVLEERSAKVGVISARADLQGEYALGRLRYHLVPHHLRRIWSNPPPAKELRGLDYVLFALPVYGMRYDDERQELVWPGGDVLPVELIHADAAMALLRPVKEAN